MTERRNRDSIGSPTTRQSTSARISPILAAASRSSSAWRRGWARPTRCCPRPNSGSLGVKMWSSAILEPHDRPATAELARGPGVGAARVDRSTAARRSPRWTPDAVMTRHPHWALVDELAHTNVPGARNTRNGGKAVEELLEAGINVITTVNIQHLESLNDTVREITGVDGPRDVPRPADRRGKRSRRRGPHTRGAYQPAAAWRGLRHGQGGPRTRRLLHARATGGAAELALRQTADEVDDQIIAALGDASAVAWAGREVVVVCATAREESVRLVRRGFRLAERLHADLHVLHVTPSGHRLSESEEDALAYLAETARNLGPT